MERINFVNNETRASADTFNTLQDNIENSIDNSIDELRTNINDALYYKSGDTVTFDQSVVASAVTASTKVLLFTLKLPKSIQNVSSATITSGGIIGRTPTGSYLDGQSAAFDITTSAFTKSINLKPSSQELYININKNVAFTNITNNMCLTLVLYNFTIRFN